MTENESKQSGVELKVEGPELKRPVTSQTTRLLELCEKIEVFHTPDGQQFAAVPVDQHRENWLIDSREFKSWVRREFYKKFGMAPSSFGLQEAIDTLLARAQFDGETCPVFLRMGSSKDNIYVDLANAAWEVVEISKSGWKVIKDSPIKFRRSKKMKELPSPVRGEDRSGIVRLRSFLNVESLNDFRLLVAFIVNAYNPQGPYLALVLYGEQGTAKSTTVKVIRALIDPSEIPLRREPKTSDDLLVSAQHNWVVAIDNMSFLPDWLSDDLCRLATGGGISKRSLYTNDEETVLEAKRPIILNGISEFVARGDLASRSITINLPMISEENRKCEKTFWVDFTKAHPFLLACLFDAVSMALRDEDSIVQEKKLRMADAWQWVTASEMAFGWERGEMVEAFRANQESANDAVLNGSIFYRYILELSKSGWSGTPSDLLSKLNSMRDHHDTYEKGWPNRPRGLTDHLRRINPALRIAGIEVILDGKTSGSNSERRITIGKLPKSYDAYDAKKNDVGRDVSDECDAKIPEFAFDGHKQFLNGK